MYQHSESFATLKNIKEEIKENFTSFQWLSVLDYFLDKTLDNIDCCYPLLVNNFLAKSIAWQANHPTTKISRIPKDELPALLFNMLTSNRRNHQRKMFLNRGMQFGLMAIFSQTVNTFQCLHEQDAANRISQLVRYRYLMPTLTYGRLLDYLYWSQKAYWFKELIMQKYIRAAIMQAKHLYVETNHAKDLDYIVQVYLSFLSKAIDRCDSRQGVLTTFISTWFFSARHTVKKMIANSQESSYDELSKTHFPLPYAEMDSELEARQHLAHIAKTLDPEGVIRYALGIPEFVAVTEQKVLSVFSTDRSII